MPKITRYPYIWYYAKLKVAIVKNLRIQMETNDLRIQRKTNEQNLSQAKQTKELINNKQEKTKVLL